jgi:3-phenylpropionate/trans-cinnamate dioxygenase ferredoxin subunit
MECASDVTHSYVPVASLADLRAGFLTIHEVEGRTLALALTDEGVTAWDATCPHAEFQFGPMRLLRGCVVECPMHGARFDVRDGHVVKGPATEPLDPIEVRVQDGVVMVLVDWVL